jgi:hypothetical protein
MDLMKIHGDIYRVKLIIVMPRIRSVLLLIGWLIQKANDAKLINGELYPSATIVAENILFSKKDTIIVKN